MNELLKNKPLKSGLFFLNCKIGKIKKTTADFKLNSLREFLQKSAK